MSFVTLVSENAILYLEYYMNLYSHLVRFHPITGHEGP